MAAVSEVAAVSAVEAAASSLPLAAGGQGSGHADSQTKGRQTMDMSQFHGYLLFLYKIAYHNIIHSFFEKVK